MGTVVMNKSQINKTQNIDKRPPTTNITQRYKDTTARKINTFFDESLQSEFNAVLVFDYSANADGGTWLMEYKIKIKL